MDKKAAGQARKAEAALAKKAGDEARTEAIEEADWEEVCLTTHHTLER